MNYLPTVWYFTVPVPGMKYTLDRTQKEHSQYKHKLINSDKEIAVLQQQLSASHSTNFHKNIELEKNHQVRLLEKENLQLIVDLTSFKKQLQSAKAEINELRMMSFRNTDVIDGLSDEVRIGTEKSVYTTSKKTRRENFNTNDKREFVKSNTALKDISLNSLDIGAQNVSKSKHPARSNKQRKSTPGLGEEFQTSEENTQECNQS